MNSSSALSLLNCLLTKWLRVQEAVTETMHIGQPSGSLVYLWSTSRHSEYMDLHVLSMSLTSSEETRRAVGGDEEG